MSGAHNTSSSQLQELNRDLYLGIYSVFVVCLLFFTLLRTQLFFKLTIVASRKLHQKMFSALLRAPSYFFDTNSIGETKQVYICVSFCLSIRCRQACTYANWMLLSVVIAGDFACPCLDLLTSRLLFAANERA